MLTGKDVQAIMGMDFNKIQKLLTKWNNRATKARSAGVAATAGVMLILVGALTLFAIFLPIILIWRYNKAPKSILTMILFVIVLLSAIGCAMKGNLLGALYHGGAAGYVGAKHFKFIK